VSFAAGDKPTAAQFFDQEDWTDYSSTFTLTASTTSPTKGNSIYLAEWLKVGKKGIHVRIRIDIGSTFSAGSGNYRFSLPTTASTNASTSTVGSVWINDSGTALRMGVVTLDSITTYATAWYQSAATAVGLLGSGGSGTAWATGDVVIINFLFEPAS
jgi:hypothetical protein